jgi:hypothetical protein
MMSGVTAGESDEVDARDRSASSTMRRAFQLARRRVERMDTRGETGRETSKVPFLVTGSKRRLQGAAAELNMVVQGRGMGDLRMNIASALRVRFGREQAFSILVGALRTEGSASPVSR